MKIFMEIMAIISCLVMGFGIGMFVTRRMVEKAVENSMEATKAAREETNKWMKAAKCKPLDYFTYKATGSMCPLGKGYTCDLNRIRR